MRLPVGRLPSGNLQFLNAEGAMAKGTDPFGSGPAEDHHVAPGAGRHRHDEPPEARAAAAALIPQRHEHEPGYDEPDAERQEGKEHVMQEERRIPAKAGQLRFGVRIRGDEDSLQTAYGSDAHGKLADQIEPILHFSY